MLDRLIAVLQILSLNCFQCQNKFLYNNNGVSKLASIGMILLSAIHNKKSLVYDETCAWQCLTKEEEILLNRKSNNFPLSVFSLSKNILKHIFPKFFVKIFQKFQIQINFKNYEQTLYMFINFAIFICLFFLGLHSLHTYTHYVCTLEMLIPIRFALFICLFFLSLHT